MQLKCIKKSDVARRREMCITQGAVGSPRVAGSSEGGAEGETLYDRRIVASIRPCGSVVAM